MRNKALLCITVLGILAACQPVINSRGNVTVAENLDKFIVGTTTANDVIAMCGTPSLHKDNFTWIYIGAKAEEISFRNVSMADRCVVKLTFDQNKILKSVDRIKLGKDDSVQNDEEVTPLITNQQAAKHAHRLLNGQ